MINLRKWLYKPRRDDKSLFAKFWYADDNLNKVAAELDSFDGRKDPERCAALVSRLRSCRDKLLGICNRMLDELEECSGGNGRTNREFRIKFPDEIVTENLGGQLWFGAECLAAGSSIMQGEFESEEMRPLARAVTKTLEKVRALIREQCLTAAPHYTEQIHETLGVFDRMFAEFEFRYVSCVVHVKTVKEYEIQQDVICLFSDTLQRAIKNDLVTQDMVDFYEPSLMFAIPRLAIVCGLVVYPSGPLNVDRDNVDFPELFRPFKNLLRKIRELLWTLTPSEFCVLERLLCHLEEPVDLERKLKAAEKMLAEKEKLASGVDQAAKLDAKLDSHSAHGDSIRQTGASDSHERRKVSIAIDLQDNSGASASQIVDCAKTCSCDQTPEAGADNPMQQNCDIHSIQTDSAKVLSEALTESNPVEGTAGQQAGASVPSNAPTQSENRSLSNEEAAAASSGHAIVSQILEDVFNSLTIKSDESPRAESAEGTVKREENVAASTPGASKPRTSTDGSPEPGSASSSRHSDKLTETSESESERRRTKKTRRKHRSSSARRRNQVRDSSESGGAAGGEPSNTATARTTNGAAPASGQVKQAVVEIDCSRPDITVAPVSGSRRERHSENGSRRRIRTIGSSEDTGAIKKNLKRRGAKRYHKNIGDARARFKSSEDLLHRLYVCISGAADQLQTNFAGDFRHILKYVFTMNSTPEVEDDEDDDDTECDEGRNTGKSTDEEEIDLSEELSSASSNIEEQQQISSADVDGARALPPRTRMGTPKPDRTRGSNENNYECGEDALITETEQSYLRAFGASIVLGQPEPSGVLGRTEAPAGVSRMTGALLSTSPPALDNMPVYASNLDQHIDHALISQEGMGQHGVGGASRGPGGVILRGSTVTQENFYQPEPALLTIAAGSAPQEEHEEARSSQIETPPAWVPDAMAPQCMGCNVSFSIMRRRHHCRSCGGVFCNKCSQNQVPLPRYGMTEPVRVCNRCYIYYMNPYEVGFDPLYYHMFNFDGSI